MGADGAALENDALAALNRSGTVREAFIHHERIDVTLVVNADSLGAAEEELGALPLVKTGRLPLAYVMAQDLLHRDEN